MPFSPRRLLNPIDNSMPSLSSNPIILPVSTRPGQNVRQQSIFCPHAPPDCATESTTPPDCATEDPPPSVDLYVQPSTAVQTTVCYTKGSKATEEAEERDTEEKSSEEDKEENSESSSEDTPQIDVKGAWEGKSKRSLY